MECVNKFRRNCSYDLERSYDLQRFTVSFKFIDTFHPFFCDFNTLNAATAWFWEKRIPNTQQTSLRLPRSNTDERVAFGRQNFSEDKVLKSYFFPPWVPSKRSRTQRFCFEVPRISSWTITLFKIQTPDIFDPKREHHHKELPSTTGWPW